MFGHYDFVVARLLADRLHRRDRWPAAHQAAAGPRVDRRLAGRLRRPLSSGHRTMNARQPSGGRILRPGARRLRRAWAAQAAGDAKGWRDVLDTPAVKSPLAARALLNGLARAGDRIVAVGQRGHVLWSDDAGKSWQQADVPVSSDLVAVPSPTPTDGWAVGHDGVVLHSTDAGQTLDRAARRPALRRADGRTTTSVRHSASPAADPKRAAALVEEAERFAAQGAENPFLDVWFSDASNGYVGRRIRPGAAHHRRRRALGAHAARRRQPEEPAPVCGAGHRRRRLHRRRAGAAAQARPRATQRFRALELPYKGTLFGVTGNARRSSRTACAARAAQHRRRAQAGSRSHTGLQVGLTGAACAGRRAHRARQPGGPRAGQPRRRRELPDRHHRAHRARRRGGRARKGTLVVAGPRGAQSLQLP